MPPRLPSKNNHQNKESIAFLHPACCWHYPDPNNQGRTTIPKCRVQSIAKSATDQKIIPPAPILYSESARAFVQLILLIQAMPGCWKYRLI